MNISIKKHIMDNFKGASKEDIRKAVEEAFNDTEEITLPGLGVFFTVIWRKSPEGEKEHILNILKDSLS